MEENQVDENPLIAYEEGYRNGVRDAINIARENQDLGWVILLKELENLLK